MALFSTLGTGASGLTVSSDNLSVIGDNIANINTVGFKGSRATFADMMPQYIGGLGSTAAAGRGALLMGVDTLFGQGSLESSGNSLDMAVNGSGLFQVANGAEKFYTRDGSFHMDQEGYIVNGMGLRVQGFQMGDNGISSIVGDLHMDLAPIAQQETEEITMDLVLQADGDYSLPGLANLGTGTWDGSATSETISDIESDADYSTSITIYDSLGVAHDVTVVFERTATDTWAWSAIVDGAESDIAGAVEGMALEIAHGDITVDTEGNITASTQSPGGTPWSFDGANTFDPTFLFGMDSAGVETAGGVRMVDGESYVVGLNQDGYTVGDLLDVQVDSDGVLTGYYSNGETESLGQVALAMFPSNGGLERLGGNLFRETPTSGVAAMGAPDVGGRGTIAGYALERANVELEDEFVSMIQAQRTYQANAGVIRSADEALQQLVNLV